jgi:lysophospholipase L1-like esterase
LSQNFDAIVSISADFSSAGQLVDFDGPVVSGLTITNTSGASIQYTADGTNWVSIVPGGTASPAVPDHTCFFLRKMSIASAPAAVRLKWQERDSVDPSNVAITGGAIGGVAVSSGGAKSILNGSLIDSAAFRNLIGAARAGVVTPVLVIGDSVGFGYGSAGVSTGHRMNGFGPQLARALNGVGIRAQAQGFLGDNGLNAAGTSRQYDSRLSGTGGGIGVTSLGGASFALLSAGNGTLTYTASQPVDTLQIYGYQFAGAGSLSYQIDANAAVPFSLNNTGGLYAPSTIPLGSLASHTISFTYVSGAGGYLLGANCYDSTIGGLQFINAAMNGAVASNFTPNVNAYDPLKIGAALAPKATIIVLGANHWNTAASLSAWSADLQTLITAYAASGPVILVSDPPTVTGTYTTPMATQLQYVQAMQNLATSNGCLMFDLWTYYGGAASVPGANWNADGIHPSQQGYGYGAGLMARALSLA